MLLREIYEKKHYLFTEEALDWETSIRRACSPLVASGVADERYEEAIIACIQKHGPYVVILPGVCLPHSTENAEGALGTAIGFMRCSQPVSFAEGNPDKDAQIFFTLVSTNPDEHMENMQKLYGILTNSELVEKLKAVSSPEELLELDALCG